jgi:hypothetical protein
MHDYRFVGEWTDSRGRTVGCHEWCCRCGTLRMTRMQANQVLYMVPNTLTDGAGWGQNIDPGCLLTFQPTALA